MSDVESAKKDVLERNNLVFRSKLNLKVDWRFR